MSKLQEICEALQNENITPAEKGILAAKLDWFATEIRDFDEKLYIHLIRLEDEYCPALKSDYRWVLKEEKVKL